MNNETTNIPRGGGTRYGVPARRKAIVDRLSEAYGSDMLDQREFERRLELAEVASTIEELDALVHDFGPAVSSVATANPNSLTVPKHFTAVGEQTHVLTPGLDSALQATVLLGSVTVDLRAFRGTGLTIPIQLKGGIGDAKIKVPQGTLIVRQLKVVVGDFTTRHARSPGVVTTFFRTLFGRPGSPQAPVTTDGAPPTVILSGFWALGSVEIEEHLP